MPGPVTEVERAAFLALCPVGWDPARAAVRVGVPGGLALDPRSARILADLLLLAAADGEAANPNRDGDWMGDDERPAF